MSALGCARFPAKCLILAAALAARARCAWSLFKSLKTNAALSCARCAALSPTPPRRTRALGERFASAKASASPTQFGTTVDHAQRPVCVTTSLPLPFRPFSKSCQIVRQAMPVTNPIDLIARPRWGFACDAANKS